MLPWLHNAFSVKSIGDLTFIALRLGNENKPCTHLLDSWAILQLPMRCGVFALSTEDFKVRSTLKKTIKIDFLHCLDMMKSISVLSHDGRKTYNDIGNRHLSPW